jgi:hypothetical protein
MNMTLVYMSMICALVATTVAESYIFKGMRDWILKKNFHIGVGINCAYCMSHWTAFVIVLVHFGYRGFVNFFDTAFVIAWLSIIQWSIVKALLKVANIKLSN